MQQVTINIVIVVIVQVVSTDKKLIVSLEQHHGFAEILSHTIAIILDNTLVNNSFKRAY